MNGLNHLQQNLPRINVRGNGLNFTHNQKNPRRWSYLMNFHVSNLRGKSVGAGSVYSVTCGHFFDFPRFPRFSRRSSYPNPPSLTNLRYFFAHFGFIAIPPLLPLPRRQK
jgi:hypothetical protein